MQLVVLGCNEKSGNFFSSCSDVCAVSEQICNAITDKHDVLGAGTRTMTSCANRVLSWLLSMHLKQSPKILGGGGVVR